MDPPSNDVAKFEDSKARGPLHKCDLYDIEVAKKIAQEILPGLSTACVDSTTGISFKTPASVAADLRKEMIDYLTHRSQTFVAESIVSEEAPANAEVSDHPYDIVSDFIDEFAMSKRNMFSRVSGWLLSESREDKIDDFVQEMEVNGFWPLDRRELVARELLKNVDFKDLYHCTEKFQSAEELAQHVPQCGFRILNCVNEGCNATFIADHLEKHDLVCLFKIIPCEQKCSDYVMRREMDRHCITLCPMKLLNCPFYPVGCQSPVPQCKIKEHCSENLNSHVVYALRGIYKEASADDLKQRAEDLQKMSSPGQLETQIVRSFTMAVKDLDAKLGPLEIKSVNRDTDEENKEITKAEHESQQVGS